MMVFPDAEGPNSFEGSILIVNMIPSTVISSATLRRWRDAVDGIRIDHGNALGVFLIRHNDPADAEMFVLANRLSRIRPTGAGRADSNSARVVPQRKCLAVIDGAAATAGRTTMDR